MLDLIVVYDSFDSSSIFGIFSGTTCATILARAIYSEGCKSVAAGMNAMDLRRGISMAIESVVTNLKSSARMISTSEEIAQVFFVHILIYTFVSHTKCCILVAY